MRYCIATLLVLWTQFCSAQEQTSARVVDESGSAVSFCSIAIKGTSKGCLANEDGLFSIATQGGDVLVFYSLGFEKRELTASEVAKISVVRLKTSVTVLSEVTVSGEDERPYQMMQACRNILLKNSMQNTRAYLQVQTRKEGQAVEMLEAYYNAEVAKKGVSSLDLKNGRVGLAAHEKRYFISFNTSKAICMLQLTGDEEHMPGAPFQLSRARMRKTYKMKLLGEDEHSYHVYFEPKKNKRSHFGGDAWVDKKTMGLLKLRMVCDKALVHPFIAYGEDTIKDVSLDITFTYEPEGGRLTLVNFGYKVKHKSVRRTDSVGHHFDSGPEKEMQTSGLLYLFDAGKPFVLPYYEYNAHYSDYRKISLIPYDPSFWQQARALIYTREQQEMLDFLEREGQLVNFKAGKFADTSRTGLFETNNFEWTDSTRINYTRNEPERIPIAKQAGVKVQIYLDVNEVADSLQHFSATVFDGLNTYMPDPVGPAEKCYMNICLDLYEIERRKMEQTLRQRKYTSQEIATVYRETVKKATEACKQFTSETDKGGKIDAMRSWNKYCYEQLGFDNMRIFDVKE